MGKGPEMRGWPIVGATVVAAAIHFSVCRSEWQMGGNQVVRDSLRVLNLTLETGETTETRVRG